MTKNKHTRPIKVSRSELASYEKEQQKKQYYDITLEETNEGKLEKLEYKLSELNKRKKNIDRKIIECKKEIRVDWEEISDMTTFQQSLADIRKSLKKEIKDLTKEMSKND